MSSKHYQESGYGLGLDLLTILQWSCFQYPRRSQLVGKSNHLRRTYLIFFAKQIFLHIHLKGPLRSGVRELLVTKGLKYFVCTFRMNMTTSALNCRNLPWFMWRWGNDNHEQAMWLYFGHFQIYRHFQQLDQLQSCLIHLAIAMNPKDCHFKFQNCNSDAKVKSSKWRFSYSLNDYMDPPYYDHY